MWRKVLFGLFLSFSFLSFAWAVEVVSIPPIKGMLSYFGLKDVVSIVSPGSDPHSFELTPSVAKALSKADRVWMINGKLEIESKLLAVIRDNYPRLEVVFLAKDVEMIDSDPHQWVSVRNLRKMIQRIGEVLGKDVDDALLGRIDGLDREFAQVFERLGVKDFLSFHPAWRYFCRDYGLNMVALAVSGMEVSGKVMYKVVQDCKAGKYRFIVLEKGFDTSRLGPLFSACSIPAVEFNPLSEDILAEFESLLDQIKAKVLR